MRLLFLPENKEDADWPAPAPSLVRPRQSRVLENSTKLADSPQWPCAAPVAGEIPENWIVPRMRIHGRRRKVQGRRRYREVPRGLCHPTNPAAERLAAGARS